MSVEKMYQSGDKISERSRGANSDLEAKYKGLGCAAVRAATAIKPVKKPKLTALQMAASMPMESD